MSDSRLHYIYSNEEYLQLITLCDEELVLLLLKDSKNDLQVAVEMFFDDEQGAGGEGGKNNFKENYALISTDVGENLECDERVIKDTESDRYPGWPLPLPAFKDMQQRSRNNLIHKLKTELMIEASSISSRYPEMDLGNLKNLLGSEMMIHKNMEEPHDLQDAANIAVDVAEYSRCVTFSHPVSVCSDAPPKLLTLVEFQPSTTDCGN